MVSTLKPMSKEKELEILNDLRAHDSYFRDAFSFEDFEQMLQNIRDDHPLMTETTFGRAVWLCQCEEEIEAELDQTPLEAVFNGRFKLNDRYHVLFSIEDVWHEGEVIVDISENRAGTDLNMEIKVPAQNMAKYSDIDDGISRIMHRIAKYLGTLDQHSQSCLFTTAHKIGDVFRF